jgi:putative tricarboxylic transport membrane protein
MYELVINAFMQLFTFSSFGMMLIGIAIGTVVGILPGLGGTVGMSLLVPFIYGMDPALAMPMFIGLAAVIHTADTFPSVLLGVPGSSGSQATIMDGYPLAKKGQAERALSAAFIASMIGGVFGALVLFLILPIARPIVLSFGSPELLMLSLLGLSMAGVLAGNYPFRGILAAFIGLFIGSIGGAPATAFYRYTFNSLYLWDGIPIAVLALGLFALPEILDLLIARRSISTTISLGKGRREGIMDAMRNKWLILRCSGIGVLIGMIPGLGGSVVDWISYGQVVQTSRDKSKFGKGDIRGVIAPESSNNAKEGGALIPTLLFGIPGSGSMAILLGVFIVLGLDPGPRMITDHLDMVVLIVLTLAIGNVLGTLTCLGLSRFVAKLSLIPATYLSPFLLVIMLTGAYQSKHSWGDLLAFLVLGLFGWIMKHLDWPRAPLLIGFVLSISVERYLWISTERFGWDWLFRPGVIIIGLLTIALSYAGSRLKATSSKRRKQVEK